MRDKNIFSSKNKLNSKTKSFITAFAVFVVILGVFSVFMFMHSIDFDLDNLVESSTSENNTEKDDEIPSRAYSVNDLNGRSDIMFIITDENERVDFIFCTFVDFDNGTFKIRYKDGDSQLQQGDSYVSINSVYAKSSVNGLKSFINGVFNTEIDKYVVISTSDLKTFLSKFDGIKINVKENVNYKSDIFDIELSSGSQMLSGEKTVNYLISCDDKLKEQVLCDIAISVLDEKYVEKSDKLFKQLVNLSETDISVIDYSNALSQLEIYCKADDRFVPIPYGE